MCPTCETRYAMRFSRGLRLGALVTTLRHLFLGGCALSLGTLAVTGHVGVALAIVAAIYLVSKVVASVTTRLRRRPC